jgi:DNA-binding PadR family transcriptional regulator
MSLEYAILGFLNYHPYTGYDLKKTFDKSVRHFWPADQSQIYRTLARLTEQGFVEMEKVEQADRPDRKVYHITAAGRSALLEWLAGPPPLSEPRSAPLIQVFFMAQLSDEEIRQRFEGYAEIMRTVLARYEQVPLDVNEIYADVQSERERFFWMLTLESGISGMRASLEWAESIIARLKSGQMPQE